MYSINESILSFSDLKLLIMESMRKHGVKEPVSNGLLTRDPDVEVGGNVSKPVNVVVHEVADEPVGIIFPGLFLSRASHLACQFLTDAFQLTQEFIFFEFGETLGHVDAFLLHEVHVLVVRLEVADKGFKLHLLLV